MYRHIVLYRLKDRSEEAKEALKANFLTLRGQVPQARGIKVSTDDPLFPRFCGAALGFTFDKKENLAACKAHPLHVEASEYVHSVIESSVRCDLGGCE